MTLSFCFSSSKQHPTSEINMCRVCLHQTSMGKSNQKMGKTHNYSSFWKSYSTSCKGIGGHKKREGIGKSKTTTLASLYNLKKKQQYQGSKNWCYFESFMLLAVSNLRTTAFCFGNLELLK